MTRSILFALLAACAAAPAPALAAEPYRAVGTEPFWSITVDGRRMTYESPERRFSVRAPRPRETGDGQIYRTRRITLHIWHGECSDGMSDRRYAQTVRAVVDGRTLNGCGGDVLASPSLAATAWSIVAIAGRPVSGANYTLQFDAARLSGQAGCNRFSGPWRVERGRLTAGPLIATRMACPGPRMAHERTAMRVVGGPAGMRFDGDTLILSAAGGTVTLRRAH